MILDLRSGQYCGFPAPAAATLGSLVRGWPLNSERGDADGLLADMLKDGLITSDPASGKDASPVAAPQPTGALIDMIDNSMASVRAQGHHFANFCWALGRASFDLRFRSIEQIVTRVSQRRARSAHSSADNPIREINELIAIFNRLQPLIFGRRDACLLHSLTLVEFLARYQHYPEWVFGVRTAPFLAHCWVQQGTVLLNDTPLHVSALTPIMIV